MKKLLFIILFAFLGMAFAGEAADSAAVKDSVAVGEVSLPAYYADSVMYADSAKYYEGLSNQLKMEADSVKKRSSWQIKAGAIATAVGAAGTLAVLGLAKNTSIEGGGAAVVFLMVPAELLLFGGIGMMSFGAIDKGKVEELREQSAAHLETAGKYREKANKERYRRTSQMMLRIVPGVDPFHKAVGAKLSLNL